jgi:hypothetical protein
MSVAKSKQSDHRGHAHHARRMLAEVNVARLAYTASERQYLRQMQSGE